MSAHKFNGPKGMGALYCRKGIWPQNLIDGGSQEARHRAGTENVAGIAGMGKALEMAVAHLDERMAHEKELRDYVIDRVLKNIPEARLNGGLEHRLPGNANISFPGLEARPFCWTWICTTSAHPLVRPATLTAWTPAMCC